MSLLKEPSSYMLKGVTLVIFLENLRSLDVLDGLPGVIAFGVPLPFDQILQFPSPAVTSMVSNCLDFVFFSIIDKVRRWPREVLSVLLRLFVGHEEGGVEGGVYGPLRGQAQLIDNWGHYFRDFEGSVTSRGQFDGSVRQGKVLCIQPHLLALFPSRFFGVVALGCSI